MSEGSGETRRVVLDPGHGEETAGKRSPDGTYLEHEFNLDMAKRVKQRLEKYGVSVTLTRNGTADVSLKQRVALANDMADLDLFVSLHSNASGDGKSWTGPKGFGIYTSTAGADAARNRAAKAILARAGEAGLSLWGDGLFHDLSLYVLRRTTAPAVLIEHGFHTNREETALLKSDSYREKLARVDAAGILDFLEITPEEDESAAVWVVERGISDGKDPDGYCTRAEVWEMLRKTIK